MVFRPPDTGNSQSMSKPSATPLLTNAAMQEATNALRLASVEATSENPAAPQPPMDRITLRFGYFCRSASTELIPDVLAVVHLPFEIVENAHQKWVTRSIFSGAKFGLDCSR